MRKIILASLGTLSIVFAASSPVVGEDEFLEGLTASNIYQRLHDVDQHGFAVRRFAAGGDAAGGGASEIVLDEQGVATGGRDSDAAANPLFRNFDRAKLAGGAYPEFIALLDNYAARATEPDSYSPEEQAEIDAFLDKAMPSRPMRVALAYVNETLGYEWTSDQFREKLKAVWFEIYENHFGGKRIPFCSGFEHVFVGEGQFPASGPSPRRGEISGYHNWVRFFLQESNDEVNYLGHKYDLPAARKPANPGVITLRMIWSHDPDGSGGEAPVELFKPKGGFFVGTSPECELAMGTVAFFEHEEGLLTDDKRRTTIDGATYDLVLYRSIEPDGGRGDFIRSFYPVLVGLAEPGDGPAPTTADGPVVIARALPNPEGDDETGEWVELKNRSEDRVDLATWELRDRQGGVRRLDGFVEAGEARRFEIPRASHSMRMGNNGGKIRLYKEEELMHEVEYHRVASDEIVEFAID